MSDATPQQPWAMWASGPGFPAMPPTVPAPAVPPKPTIDASLPPGGPNRVKCRCGKWVLLGDNPAATLRSMWYAYAADAQQRSGERWDAPAPELPANPSKVACPCGKWIDLGDDVADRLKREHVDWLDEQQSRADGIWRASPAHQLAALFAGQADGEARAEVQARKVAEARRDEAMGRRVSQLVALGVPALEAVSAVEKEFAEAAK
jgi:hypothetical protein